jgi:hypothetical protein
MFDADTLRASSEARYSTAKAASIADTSTNLDVRCSVGKPIETRSRRGDMLFEMIV